jgi:hypothetical protein
VSPVSPICPTSPVRSAGTLGIERMTARAEADVARCRRALDRLRLAGKRTRRVGVILCLARGRLAVSRLGLSCFA